MTHIYLKSKDYEALLSIKSYAINVIGPIAGRAAIESQTLSDGSVTDAQTAIGDPDYWYVCLNFPFSIEPSLPVESCDGDEGKAVCGIWA